MFNEQSSRCCTIYQGHGETSTQPVELDDDALVTRRPLAPRRTIADRVPIGQIMCRALVCATPDLDIETVIGLMIRNHLGCLPVVDDRRRPVGMITKFDVVEHVDAYLRSNANGSPLPIDLVARSADEVMMPIALTLEEHSSVADAASIMTCEDMHHILVVSARGTLVGVVSTKDIVTWLVVNDGLMPYTEASNFS